MSKEDPDDDRRAIVSINVSDVLGLSKAGEELTKAITRGTGRAIAALGSAVTKVAYPYLRKRDAAADAAAVSVLANTLQKAGLELTEAEIDLGDRTVARLSAESVRHQVNREQIAFLALSEHVESRGDQKTSVNEMSVDWVDAFWRFAETVNDATMQSAWAHVLTREASRPGTFSMRCLAVLSTLSLKEAEAITAVARVAYDIKSPTASGIDHGVITTVRSTAGPEWTREVAQSFEARLRERVPVFGDFLGPIGIYRESGFSHVAVAMPDSDNKVSMRIAGETLHIRGLRPPGEPGAIGGHLGSGHGITALGWELMQIARPKADAEYVALLKEIYERQGCQVSLRQSA